MNRAFHFKADNQVLTPRSRRFHSWVLHVHHLTQNILHRAPKTKPVANTLTLEEFMDDWDNEGRICI